MSMSDGFDLHQSISIQLPYSIDDILYIYIYIWEDIGKIGMRRHQVPEGQELYV